MMAALQAWSQLAALLWALAAFGRCNEFERSSSPLCALEIISGREHVQMGRHLQIVFLTFERDFRRSASDIRRRTGPDD
jgi:hypothetical protein